MPEGLSVSEVGNEIAEHREQATAEPGVTGWIAIRRPGLRVDDHAWQRLASELAQARIDTAVIEAFERREENA